MLRLLSKQHLKAPVYSGSVIHLGKTRSHASNSVRYDLTANSALSVSFKEIPT